MTQSFLDFICYFWDFITRYSDSVIFCYSDSIIFYIWSSFFYLVPCYSDLIILLQYLAIFFIFRPCATVPHSFCYSDSFILRFYQPFFILLIVFEILSCATLTQTFCYCGLTQTFYYSVGHFLILLCHVALTVGTVTHHCQFWPCMHAVFRFFSSGPSISHAQLFVAHAPAVVAREKER
jgi:hypothetical protein